jgi:hypothetical protein
VAEIEGAAAAIQSRELELGEEKGVQRLAGSGSDRATWSGSNRWANGRQVGQGGVLTRN